MWKRTLTGQDRETQHGGGALAFENWGYNIVNSCSRATECAMRDSTPLQTILEIVARPHEHMAPKG